MKVNGNRKEVNTKDGEAEGGKTGKKIVITDQAKQDKGLEQGLGITTL